MRNCFRDVPPLWTQTILLRMDVMEIVTALVSKHMEAILKELILVSILMLLFVTSILLAQGLLRMVQISKKAV